MAAKVNQMLREGREEKSNKSQVQRERERKK